MKIAILGTVGVPGRYGGFETLAENLVHHHARTGRKAALTVWCSSKAMPDRPACFETADLRYVGLRANGVQSIPYDMLGLADALRTGHDRIVLLGVSGALALPLVRLVSRARIVTNIDGIEWRREKWRGLARAVLRASEWAAVRFSHAVIADNEAIAEHVRQTYGRDCHVIAYGGDHAVAPEGVHDRAHEGAQGEAPAGARDTAPDGAQGTVPDNRTIPGPKPGQEAPPGAQGTQSPAQDDAQGPTRNGAPHVPDRLPERYALALCRIEPENNVAMILEAFAGLPGPLVFVGNWDNSAYGRDLRARYGDVPNLHLLDPVYDPAALRALRGRASVYVHGHSAGGTNPALVEMMFFGIPVLAHDCAFNRHSTEDRALYFDSADALRDLAFGLSPETAGRVGADMRSIAARRYTWEHVGEAYFALLGSPRGTARETAS